MNLCVGTALIVLLLGVALVADGAAANVVYRRLSKTSASDPKVTEIREIFKTARRPPAFGRLMDADINRFLERDAYYQRSRPTKFDGRKKLTTTKAPFIIAANPFENQNPDYSLLLPPSHVPASTITTLAPTTRVTTTSPEPTTTYSSATITEEPHVLTIDTTTVGVITDEPATATTSNEPSDLLTTTPCDADDPDYSAEIEYSVDYGTIELADDDPEYNSVPGEEQLDEDLV